MSGRMIDIGKREPGGPPVATSAESRVYYPSVTLEAKDFPGLRKAKMGQRVRVIATVRKMHDGAKEDRYGPDVKKALVEVEIQAIQEAPEEDFAKTALR